MKPKYSFAAVMAGFLLLGCLRGWMQFQAHGSDAIQSLDIQDGMLMQWRGRVRDDVQAIQFPIREQSQDRNVPYQPPKQVRFTVTLTSYIDAHGQEQRCRGKVRVSTAVLLPCRYGDEIEVVGPVRVLRPPGNPGQFDYAAKLFRQGIAHEIRVQSVDQVRILHRPTWTVPGQFHKLREHLTAVLAHYLEGDHLALYATLLLGNRSMMQEELRDAFVESGTMHLLAISGLHLVFWVACVNGLASWMGIAARGRVVLSLLFVMGFIMLVGPRAPVLRASMMLAGYAGTILFDRRANGPNLLSVAALVVILMQPADLWNAGFYLSFAAVIGIMTLLPRIQRWLPGQDPADLEIARLTGKPNRFEGLQRFFLLSMATSVAAFIMIWPLTWYWFSVIAPMGVVANVLGVLGLICSQVSGLAVLVAHFLLPSLAEMAAGLAIIFSDFLIRQAQVFSSLQGSHIYLPSPPVMFLILYYTSLAILLWLPMTKLRRFCCGVIATLLLMAIAFLGMQRSPPDELRLTMLDVGNGSAMVIECPDGKVYLYDCGSSGSGSMGARIVAPYLWHRRIRHLDAVILSHQDADHINGLPSLLERVTVDTIWVTQQFASSKRGRTFLHNIQNSNRVRNGVTLIQRGDVIVNSNAVTMTVLHPESEYNDEDANNESLLIRLDAGIHHILLTGDLEDAGVEHVKHRDLQADVLQVPHHGSFLQEYSGLLQSVRPEYALASTNRRLPENVQTMYRERGIQLFRTDHHGAVVLHLPATGPIQIHTQFQPEEP